MQAPPRWSEAEVAAEAARSRALFREERLTEPLEKWKNTIERYRASFGRLFRDHGVAHPDRMGPAELAAIFTARMTDVPRPARGTRLTAAERKLGKESLGAALRYLAGPPISEDDLVVLSNVDSITPGRLTADPEAAARVLETIRQALDTTRMPWLARGREPTPAEMKAAIDASAALITAQRVSTDRRNEGKDIQERRVKEFLEGVGFTAVAARSIPTLDAAPLRGEFCAESLVGSRKADVPVRLFDGRLMPIECKVSNSEVNSVKRINNDAAIKATTWRHELGNNQVVPVAMLSGVFKVANLVQAQEAGLTLFWAHDLDAMHAFIEATRPVPTPARRR
jgi:hypothetical protein